MHPTSRLPSRATLFVVAFLPSQLCACVCHVCACAHRTSVCAKCAGMQGRAGPVAGARACRGCPILSTLGRHAVGSRGGVVSTGAHACFPRPPPSRSLVQGAVLWSHPVLGGLWITLLMEWGVGRVVTLIGLRPRGIAGTHSLGSPCVESHSFGSPSWSGVRGHAHRARPSRSLVDQTRAEPLWNWAGTLYKLMPTGRFGAGHGEVWQAPLPPPSYRTWLSP